MVRYLEGGQEELVYRLFILKTNYTFLRKICKPKERMILLIQKLSKYFSISCFISQWNGSFKSSQSCWIHFGILLQLIKRYFFLLPDLLNSINFDTVSACLNSFQISSHAVESLKKVFFFQPVPFRCVVWRWIFPTIKQDIFCSAKNVSDCLTLSWARFTSGC